MFAIIVFITLRHKCKTCVIIYDWLFAFNQLCFEKNTSAWMNFSYHLSTVLHVLPPLFGLICTVLRLLLSG